MPPHPEPPTPRWATLQPAKPPTQPAPQLSAAANVQAEFATNTRSAPAGVQPQSDAAPTGGSSNSIQMDPSLQDWLHPPSSAEAGGGSGAAAGSSASARAARQTDGLHGPVQKQAPHGGTRIHEPALPADHAEAAGAAAMAASQRRSIGAADTQQVPAQSASVQPANDASPTASAPNPTAPTPTLATPESPFKASPASSKATTKAKAIAARKQALGTPSPQTKGSKEGALPSTKLSSSAGAPSKAAPALQTAAPAQGKVAESANVPTPPNPLPLASTAKAGSKAVEPAALPMQHKATLAKPAKHTASASPAPARAAAAESVNAAEKRKAAGLTVAQAKRAKVQPAAEALGAELGEAAGQQQAGEKRTLKQGDGTKQAISQQLLGSRASGGGTNDSKVAAVQQAEAGLQPSTEGRHSPGKPGAASRPSSAAGPLDSDARQEGARAAGQPRRAHEQPGNTTVATKPSYSVRKAQAAPGRLAPASLAGPLDKGPISQQGNTGRQGESPGVKKRTAEGSANTSAEQKQGGKRLKAPIAIQSAKAPTAPEQPQDVTGYAPAPLLALLCLLVLACLEHWL